jgi:arylsulfatase A-like enzyme
MGCAGHPILKTPIMDRLAAHGVRFENMFVTTPICAASRGTLLTGLYERTHRFTFGTPPLAARYCQTSYPALLRAAGYRTGFVGKLGVEIARDHLKEMFDYYEPLSRNPYFKQQADGSQRHVTQVTGDHAITFLRQHKRERPFCLSVSFNAPHAEDADKENHYPWPKSVDGLYENAVMPPPRLSRPEIFESQPEFLKRSLNRQRWFWRWDTPVKYQRNMRAYYRMISGVDHAMGRVLAELERLDLAKDSVVIFSSDNGYYLGSRGFAGKWSHYDESLRVPLIIYDPRLPEEQRARVEKPIALNTDIAPTILALAGLDPPAKSQGRSLLPLVHGQAIPQWRTEFFCEHLFDHESIPKWEGVRSTRWMYARYFEQSPVYEFLHDLRRDPDQLKNLAVDPACRSALAELQERCDELRDHYGGSP